MENIHGLMMNKDIIRLTVNILAQHKRDYFKRVHQDLLHCVYVWPVPCSLSCHMTDIQQCHYDPPYKHRTWRIPIENL